MIQHPLPKQTYNLVLISYAAALFWSPKEEQWMTVGNYTSYLSQLIYNCQIMVLAHALAVYADDPNARLWDVILAIRDQWMLNDTKSPVAKLLGNRLLGFWMAHTEVPPAQLQWHHDEQTLTFQDMVFSLTDLHTVIWRSLAAAQQIFEQELCLSGPG